MPGHREDDRRTEALVCSAGKKKSIQRHSPKKKKNHPLPQVLALARCRNATAHPYAARGTHAGEHGCIGCHVSQDAVRWRRRLHLVRVEPVCALLCPPLRLLCTVGQLVCPAVVQLEKGSLLLSCNLGVVCNRCASGRVGASLEGLVEASGG